MLTSALFLHVYITQLLVKLLSIILILQSLSSDNLLQSSLYEARHKS